MVGSHWLEAHDASSCPIVDSCYNNYSIEQLLRMSQTLICRPSKYNNYSGDNIKSSPHARWCYNSTSATFPQCNIWREFPEILSQNVICYHWQHMFGNPEMMHSGILFGMPLYRVDIITFTDNGESKEQRFLSLSSSVCVSCVHTSRDILSYGSEAKPATSQPAVPISLDSRILC